MATAYVEALAATSDRRAADLRTLGSQTFQTVTSASGGDQARLSAEALAGAVPTNTRISQEPLWALTELLYRRAQEEIVTSHLYRIRDWFDGDDDLGSALSSTFPTTSSLLDAMLDGSETSLVSIPQGSWRSALRQDIRSLPLTMTAESTFRRFYQVAAKSEPPDTILARVRQTHAAVRIAALVADGASPFEFTEQLPDLTDDLLPDTALAKRIGAGAALVRDLARDYRAQGFVPAAAANPATLPGYVLSRSGFDSSGPTQQTIYAQLLVQRHFRPFIASSGVTLKDVNGEMRRTLARIEQAVLQLNTQSGEAADVAARYRAYMIAVMALTDITLDLGERLASGPDKPALSELRTRLEAVTAIYTALSGGDYVHALTETMLLYQTSSGAAPHARVTRVLTLGATVAGARTGDEVEAAFRASAMPAGGFRAKRNSESGLFSVSAYPGVAIGFDRVFTSEPDGLDDPADCLEGLNVLGRGDCFAGVSLPVGLDVSFRILPRWVPDYVRNRFAFFVPALDLGTLLSYRLSGSTGGQGENETVVTTAPNVSLRQVFAPGLFVTYLPFSNTPLALGVGVQIAPALRDISKGTVVDRPADALRFGLTLSTDLTLFQF